MSEQIDTREERLMRRYEDGFLTSDAMAAWAYEAYQAIARSARQAR